MATEKTYYGELKAGDTFYVEFGDYGNWTPAIVKAIRQPLADYPEVLEFDFTIPHYRGDEVLTHRFCANRRIRPLN